MTTATRQQYFTALANLGGMDDLYQAIPADTNSPDWVDFWSAEYITSGDNIAALTQSALGWTDGQMIALFNAAENVPVVVPATSNTVTSTANNQINGALRLLGVLAEGETPSAETSQDALFALNQMIDSWNTERLAVFSTQDQVFLWPAGELSRTLGPSGDFVGNRPVLVDDSTYFRDPQTNVSYGIKIINQQQYNGIAVKTVTSTYPQVIWINMTYPNIEMYVYPKPLRQLEWHFISVDELTNPATLGTTLAFPPGYLRAFRYNLACELAPEFGVEPSAQVQRIAMYSKRNLKRINNPDDIMALPYSIVGTRQRFNVYAGNM
jgi:hypothetical protein